VFSDLILTNYNMRCRGIQPAGGTEINLDKPEAELTRKNAPKHGIMTAERAPFPGQEQDGREKEKQIWKNG
jgi:hypothetical protein